MKIKNVFYPPKNELSPSKNRLLYFLLSLQFSLIAICDSLQLNYIGDDSNLETEQSVENASENGSDENIEESNSKQKSTF